MVNVPAWKDSKARRAVLGQMSVQMNVLDMVHVKLVDVFATLLGAVKDVLNLNQHLVQTIVHPVVCVTMANASVNLA